MPPSRLLPEELELLLTTARILRRICVHRNYTHDFERLNKALDYFDVNKIPSHEFKEGGQGAN